MLIRTEGTVDKTTVKPYKAEKAEIGDAWYAKQSGAKRSAEIMHQEAALRCS